MAKKNVVSDPLLSFGVGIAIFWKKEEMPSDADKCGQRYRWRWHIQEAGNIGGGIHCI